MIYVKPGERWTAGGATSGFKDEFDDFENSMAIVGPAGVVGYAVSDEETFETPDLVARACLMAAAPDLLAVVSKLVDFATDGNAFTYPPGTLEEMAAAVLKAHGVKQTR